MRPPMPDPKKDLLALGLRRAFEDYYGKNAERLPRSAVKSVVRDEIPVEQPPSDHPGDY